MIVEKGFPHETHSTNQTFIRLLVAVYKPMCIAVISTVECFSADLQFQWKKSESDTFQQIINSFINFCLYLFLVLFLSFIISTYSNEIIKKQDLHSQHYGHFG